MAMKTSPRPKKKPVDLGMSEAEITDLQKKMEGDTRKYAKGGMVRGAGCATKGKGFGGKNG